MDTPVAAIAIIVAGVVIAAVGAVLSTRTSRRATTDAEAGTRSDLAIAVAVVGLVAVLFGAAYLGYLLTTQG